MFFKIDVLKDFAIFTGKHLCWSLFLIKLPIFRQETAGKMFSWEYCDIFKSSFFHRPLPVNTSQDIFYSDVPRCSRKKFLKNFERLTAKHLYQSLFLNKIAGLGPATFLKKRPHTGVFLRIFKNTSFHGARLVAASADCQKKDLLENSLKTFFEIKFH